MKKTAKTFIVAVLLYSLVLQNIKAMTKITSIAEIPAIQLLPHPETGVLVPEEWRNIEGYEGRYQISNYGRVKTLARYRQPYEKLIKLCKSKKGYLVTYVTANGAKKNFQTHRLVMMAFVDNPENKPQVNHKNGIKADNFIHNLEWSTPSENAKHAFRTGLNRVPTSENHRTTKLTNEQVLEIRRLAGTMPVKDIAVKFDSKYTTIFAIIKRQSWKFI